MCVFIHWLWAGNTQLSDCKCAETWEYKGNQYRGCTTQDWPLPWCASDGCGMKLDSVSTGYWADCKPFGANATLDSLLMKSGEECDLNALSANQLEALRPPDYRYSTSWPIYKNMPIFVCVCVCVCACVCVRACTYECVRVCVYVCTHTNTHTHTRTRARARAHTHTHMISCGLAPADETPAGEHI